MFWQTVSKQSRHITHGSRALKSRNKTDELRACIWLRAAIYLVNSLVKKLDFRLIAAALKRATTVLEIKHCELGSRIRDYF